MEDFVTFEIAKKLKEKGFEWGKITTYNPKTKVRNNHLEPTISQVLKWLRKENKISIDPGIHCSLKWVCGIYGFNDGIDDFTPYSNDGIDDTVYILYDSYEQAVLAGIEYATNNLI